MKNKFVTAQQLFNGLEGTWAGNGRGQFPGVTSFDYRETLTFTRRDEKTLAYEQRTQKQYEGQTEWLESHWENGFLRILENGELEMLSAQIGRAEVLTGSVETPNTTTYIHFVSKTIVNDPRMISSARKLILDGDALRYEMEMKTTKVDHSTAHLKSDLKRIG